MERLNILVTGGAGFLGLEICRALKASGHHVYSCSRGRYEVLNELEVEQFQVDLTKSESFEAIPLTLEIDAVIHTAALAGIWGKKEHYFSINYEGTKNLLDFCKKRGIRDIIYTSTPSVVYGKHDLEGVDETTPYASTYLTHYAASKAKAEKLVLDMANKGEFRALALRPHLIWGKDDPHFNQKLVQSVRAGKFKCVGEGENLVDVIYVKNAAYAHLQALYALRDAKPISGQAYFIGQEKPVKLWDFLAKLLAVHGLSLPTQRISSSKAYFLGAVFEFIFKLLGINSPIPPMTRFLALQLSTSHYFSHEKAKKDFNFSLKFSTDEAFKDAFDNKDFQLKKKVVQETDFNQVHQLT